MPQGEVLLSYRWIDNVLRKQLMETSSNSGLADRKQWQMTDVKPTGRPRCNLLIGMILVLTIVLAIVTLFSIAELQSWQQISRVKQIGLSVVSGQVTSSNGNLANVPFPRWILFDPGFNNTVSANIMTTDYIAYLIDGLGYQVTIQFSNKTLCQVGTFVPKGSVVFHDFSC